MNDGIRTITVMREPMIGDVYARLPFGFSRYTGHVVSVDAHNKTAEVKLRRCSGIKNVYPWALLDKSHLVRRRRES